MTSKHDSPRNALARAAEKRRARVHAIRAHFGAESAIPDGGRVVSWPAGRGASTFDLPVIQTKPQPTHWLRKIVDRLR